MCRRFAIPVIAALIALGGHGSSTCAATAHGAPVLLKRSAGLAALVLATVIVGFGNYLGASASGH